MKRHIPRPHACVFQFITLFVVAAPLIPIVLKTDGLLMGALITVVGLLWVADLLVFVLSFVFWWNVPMTIGKEGISSGGKKPLPWDAISAVRIARKIRTQYGPTLVVAIDYVGGERVSFEYYKSIYASILEFCSDDASLRKINDCLKEYIAY